LWPDSPESGAGLAESPAKKRGSGNQFDSRGRFVRLRFCFNASCLVAQRFVAGLPKPGQPDSGESGHNKC